MTVSTKHFTRILRTAAALRAVHGSMAAAVLALAAVTGQARDTAGPSTASAAVVPPGAIGAMRHPQPGPRPESMLPHAVQPIEIRGPRGMQVAIETADGWSATQAAPLRMGLVVGHAYRLRLTGLPGHEGRELFPSLRVLAKLATPPGTAWRFPIEIVVDQDDIDLALTGSHVRRVVYSACDPDLPDVNPAGWFDIKPGDDGLAVAATLGDPVAELVIGNRLPTDLAAGSFSRGPP